MQHKKFVACAAAALMSVALGCSNESSTPVSPTGAAPGASGAGPSGETLKATAPTPQSPINGAQPDSLVLVTGKASPSFSAGGSPAYAYEFEVRNSAGTAAMCPSTTVAGGSGSSVSATPVCNLEFDQSYTWRVRAVFAGAQGPWSPNATFRAPAGGYIRGNEVMDPLTNGRTAGEISGPTQWEPGLGLRLLDHGSFVTYRLPQNLQEGELSMMILNGDEGNPGDKSKVFSMQEGPDVSDITTDDYRATIELRGRNYGAPGTVNFRIIPGDGEPRDAERSAVNFNSSIWYFWRFTWRTGFAQLEVKENGPNGRTVWQHAVGTGSHPYRPDPHYIHLGAPIGRGGALDGTMPGIVIKNVWASSRPRPAFPGEQ
jgi:hypothetical protein